MWPDSSGSRTLLPFTPSSPVTLFSVLQVLLLALCFLIFQPETSTLKASMWFTSVPFGEVQLHSALLFQRLSLMSLGENEHLHMGTSYTLCFLAWCIIYILDYLLSLTNDATDLIRGIFIYKEHSYIKMGDTTENVLAKCNIVLLTFRKGGGYRIFQY